MALALALTLLAAPAARGETPLSAAEFDALSRGKTFYYESAGQPFGAEQYLPGRRVLWAFTGDICMKGYWYEQGEFICFVYVDEPDPQCWTFFLTDTGIGARFQGEADGTALYSVQESPGPLPCAGPPVGV